MKYKHIIAIFLLGVLVHQFGIWRKIMHYAGADIAITIGVSILCLALLLAIIKILFSKKKDDFLNK